jgi:hypothetical protein
MVSPRAWAQQPGDARPTETFVQLDPQQPRQMPLSARLSDRFCSLITLAREATRWRGLRSFLRKRSGHCPSSGNRRFSCYDAGEADGDIGDNAVRESAQWRPRRRSRRHPGLEDVRSRRGGKSSAVAAT